MGLANDLEHLGQRVTTLESVALRALRGWADTINFDDQSEANSHLVAEFAWAERDFEKATGRKESYVG